jgi:DNA-binding transcriptional LysR family regulator
VRIELSTGTNDALLQAVLARRAEAAFVVESAGALQLESMPTFDEELVVIAARSYAKIRSARDVRGDTVIAFPTGCAYRRRLQHWFAASDLMPERVLELSSYHAIVACVASGTGVAVMPQSVLATVRGGDALVATPLPASARRVTTCLVWRKGESSPALDALKAAISSNRKAKKPPR